MVRFLAALTLVLCLGGFMLAAAEQTQLDNPDPFAEFWNNVMKQPFKDTGWFDDKTTFGYIMNNLEMGGYVRARPEGTELLTTHNIFGPTPTLAQFNTGWADFIATRAMFHVTVPLTPDIKFYGEMINLNVFGENTQFKQTPSGFPREDPQVHEPQIELYQGYGQWDNFIVPGMSAKVGRQELNYGDGFILSNNPFYAGLSFDAAKVSIKSELTTVDFWAGEVSSIFKPAGPTDPRIYGGYCTYAFEPSNSLDFFAFLNTDEMILNNLPAGTQPKADFVDEERYTVGSRLHGDFLPDVDYNLEGAYQFGRTGTNAPGAAVRDQVRAYAVQGGIGKTWKEAQWAPRIGMKAGYASGDADPTDSKNTVYNPLYRNQHAMNGYADAVTFSNLVDYAVEGSLKPYENITCGTEGHFFYLANHPGAQPSTLGQELDLFAKMKATDNLSLELGYALFAEGQAFESVAGNREHDQRVYLNVEYSF